MAMCICVCVCGVARCVCVQGEVGWRLVYALAPSARPQLRWTAAARSPTRWEYVNGV